MSLEFKQFGFVQTDAAGAAVFHSETLAEMQGQSRRESVQQVARLEQALRQADSMSSRAWQAQHDHVHHNPFGPIEAHDPTSFRGDHELIRGLEHQVSTGLAVTAAVGAASHQAEAHAHAHCDHLDPMANLSAPELARIAEQYRQIFAIDRDAHHSEQQAPPATEPRKTGLRVRRIPPLRKQK